MLKMLAFNFQGGFFKVVTHYFVATIKNRSDWSILLIGITA